jgi:multidrug efflux pump subunit AcrB
LKTTNAVLREVEIKLKKLPENEIESIVRNAGMIITESEWVFNTASGHIMVDLVERNNRDRSIDEIIAFCREITTDIPGPLSIEFRKLRAGPPQPKDIEVKVQGKYLDDLKTISEELKRQIAKIPGVYGLQNDLEFGKKDLKIRVNEEKAALYGFDVFTIASSIRNAYNGKVATVFRDGDEEIDVIVKYDPQQVQTIDDIKALKIPTPDGDLVPISNVADITLESGYTKIRHFKLDRAATLSADVDKNINTPFEVNQQLEKDAQTFIKKYPGYSIRFEGIFKEMKEQFSSIGQLFILGIFLIYMILGAQFKSYIQPFIILFAVPFTFIGAVSSLIITGKPFSLVVLYGFIGLAGIAVNDSIVMLTFINNARANGRGRWQSIVEAGRLRLRPIILTSITTMFGVFPMAMGLGGKSEIWAPMASTIFWGLAGATLMTLLLMPCIYTIIIDDLPLLFKRKTKNA